MYHRQSDLVLLTVAQRGTLSCARSAALTPCPRPLERTNPDLLKIYFGSLLSGVFIHSQIPDFWWRRIGHFPKVNYLSHFKQSPSLQVVPPY